MVVDSRSSWFVVSVCIVRVDVMLGYKVFDLPPSCGTVRYLYLHEFIRRYNNCALIHANRVVLYSIDLYLII